VKRLTTFESLGRGIANVRGNRELVVVVAAGSVALASILGLSLAPWFAALGIKLEWLFGSQPTLAELGEVGRALLASGPLLPRVVLFVCALGAALTVASIIYCWYFGGALGVLYAGDAQAPAGGGREPLLFRTWNRSFFLGESRRLVWKMFWFYSFFVGVWLLLILLLATIGLAAVIFGSRSGPIAGIALGCGAFLPFLFVVFLALAGTELGQGAAVDPELDVTACCRLAMRVLGARLGATTALILIFISANLAANLFLGGVGFSFGLLLAGQPVAKASAGITLFLAQVLCSSALGLILAASCIALLRGERRFERESAS
jgi:hypothetical protein